MSSSFFHSIFWYFSILLKTLEITVIIYSLLVNHYCSWLEHKLIAIIIIFQPSIPSSDTFPLQGISNKESNFAAANQRKRQQTIKNFATREKLSGRLGLGHGLATGEGEDAADEDGEGEGGGRARVAFGFGLAWHPYLTNAKKQKFFLCCCW